MKHHSPMLSLLTVTAVVEAVAGVALLAAPALSASLLVGATLDTPTGLTVGRVAGTALIALGIACWCARGDENSRATVGVVAAMLFYNVAVVAILSYVGLAEGMVGIALWPAVVLHAILAGWCVACLRPRNRSMTEAT